MKRNRIVPGMNGMVVVVVVVAEAEEVCMSVCVRGPGGGVGGKASIDRNCE